MASARVELVKTAYDAWNRGDIDVMMSVCHPDLRIRPVHEMVEQDDSYTGQAGLVRWYGDVIDPWADFRVEIDELSEPGDKVLALVRFIGKPADGTPPMEVEAAHLFEFRAGKVVRLTGFTDRGVAARAAGAG